MKRKSWVILFVVFTITSIFCIAAFNYIINPYGMYTHNYLDLKKVKQSSKIRLVKSFQIDDIKPKSIILGTSRAEYAYDPTHKFFVKPSYNAATSGASMYENRLYFEWALKQGNLEQILLVADYRMFNAKKQKNVSDIDSYFDKSNSIYKFLFSISTIVDSYDTIFAKWNGYEYLKNGQRIHGKSYYSENLAMRSESYRFKDYPNNYTYRDTKNKSFLDFEYILEQCYQNDINVDIIFGPSHIRLWESLDYYLDYKKWLIWKKDVVLSNNKTALKYHKKEYRIKDFSIYNEYTSEKIPLKYNTMNYYWDSSHYKNELGLMVLDSLMHNKSDTFGVVLTVNNVDEHLRELNIQRNKFIDINLYKEKMLHYLGK